MGNLCLCCFLRLDGKPDFMTPTDSDISRPASSRGGPNSLLSLEVIDLVLEDVNSPGALSESLAVPSEPTPPSVIPRTPNLSPILAGRLASPVYYNTRPHILVSDYAQTTPNLYRRNLSPSPQRQPPSPSSSQKAKRPLSETISDFLVDVSVENAILNSLKKNRNRNKSDDTVSSGSGGWK